MGRGDVYKRQYLTRPEVEDAFSELEEIEKLHFARLACPLMIEIIAEKN